MKALALHADSLRILKVGKTYAEDVDCQRKPSGINRGMNLIFIAVQSGGTASNRNLKDLSRQTAKYKVLPAKSDIVF